MEKCKRGDINLLLFFLASAFFVLGMTILWTSNWLIDVNNADNSSVFISKMALDRKLEKQRKEHLERLNENFEISDRKK
jgi:hypothetical protein